MPPGTDVYARVLQEDTVDGCGVADYDVGQLTVCRPGPYGMLEYYKPEQLYRRNVAQLFEIIDNYGLEYPAAYTHQKLVDVILIAQRLDRGF